MPEVSINYIAVLVAGVINMVVGGLWYSPALFGNAWMRMVNITEEGAKKGAAKAYSLMFIIALISTFALAHFVDYTQAVSFVDGMKTALWLWVGFVGAVMITDVIFAKRPFKLFLITSGYQLVVMLINGGILAIWQ